MPTDHSSRLVARAARRPHLPGLVEQATATLFQGLSVLRGKRIVHPRGVAFRATLSVPEGAPRLPVSFLEPGARWPAVVRLSNSLGLPDPLPDVRGLAIRLPDAYGPGRHQDLLLDTCGEGPLLQQVFLPALGYSQRAYSSVLPYQVGTRQVLFGARYEGDSLDGRVRFEDLPALAAMHRLQFQLAVAPRWGRWKPVARVDIGERLPQVEADALRLDPWNTGEDLQPAGLLNRLRSPAYRASQQAGHPR